MDEFPKGGIIGKTVHLAQHYSRMNISLYAANASFFIILSVFPLLLVLLGLIQYTPLEVEPLGEMLEGVLPETLLGPAEELILTTYDKASSASALGLSAVTALWSSGRGIYALMTGLNAIDEEKEHRSYLRTRLLCVVYTLALLVVLVLTLGLHVFSRELLGIVASGTHPLLRVLAWILNRRFFVLLIAQTAVFSAMFMVLPARNHGFWESLPGALLACLGWLVFSNLYSIYVERFAHLSNIYGSVYAIALYMLWLYCCMSIVLSGGALNRFLRDAKAA